MYFSQYHCFTALKYCYHFRKSPDVVIATPGRLIDHIKNTPSFSLDTIEVLILDEAGQFLISVGYPFDEY